MSGVPNESNSGGLAIVLVVYFTLGFALTIGGQAIFARLFERPVPESEQFDPSPVVDLIQPDPSYSPDEVVGIQIEGLENPNISAGIQQCFAFASLENRSFTGPLERFAAMVRRSPYDVLMHHQLVLIGQPIMADKAASLTVTLLDDHNQIHVFQFVLSKQQGETFKDCWMTDAVYPLRQMPSPSPSDSPAEDEGRRSAYLRVRPMKIPCGVLHG